MTSIEDRVLACSWGTDDLPWARYRARVDLLGEPEQSRGVQAARRAMLEHPLVQSLVEQLGFWPGELLKSHKAAGHPLHKLVFLADIGLRFDDPGVKRIVDRVFNRRSNEGPFQLLMNIGPSHGGSGQDQWAWMLCDAPLVAYALVKLGLEHDDRVLRAIDYMVSLVRPNAWPCVVAPELGTFHGPGSRSDPCPYATLIMLKLLGAMDPAHLSESAQAAAHFGAGTLLHLWETRTQRRPYMFGMGVDFAKLKAPFIWYDILHVADVLSRFEWLRGDVRLQGMADIVTKKADADARFTPESIWLSWKSWDFGQKHAPSPWLTLLAHRMLARMETGGPTQ